MQSMSYIPSLIILGELIEKRWEGKDVRKIREVEPPMIVGVSVGWFHASKEVLQAYGKLEVSSGRQQSFRIYWFRSRKQWKLEFLDKQEFPEFHGEVSTEQYEAVFLNPFDNKVFWDETDLTDHDTRVDHDSPDIYKRMREKTQEMRRAAQSKKNEELSKIGTFAPSVEVVEIPAISTEEQREEWAKEARQAKWS